jgi:hypothetical protein
MPGGTEALRNPFEFGRELRPDELVDRRSEIDTIRRVVENRGKLFLVGPRRFGKTCVLAAAEHELAREGAVVLRYDAEAFETVTALAQAAVAAAAKKLTSTLEKGAEALRQLLRGLRPEIAYDPVTQSFSVGLGPRPAKTEIPALTDVLDGIERLAAESGRTTAVFIDEFQQVVLEGGVTAERQIRAAIQKHAHVAYVFAGSKTRFLDAMTGKAGRPFWRMGSRLHLGPVPREEFLAFLDRGFRSLQRSAERSALERILALAEDVPYNVQRLAHECWERLRVQPTAQLASAFVDEALETVVRAEYPAYARIWVSLTRAQKVALKAAIEERGRGLTAGAVLRRYGLGSSTMQKALRALEARDLLRLDQEGVERAWRLEDPFLAAWLRLAQTASAP